jgi:hypothetical protein
VPEGNPPQVARRALDSSTGEAQGGETSTDALKHITEAAWQRTVVDLFRLHGWRVWHDTTAWRSDPGWPDLVCVHPQHGVRFIELKRESGRLRPAQRDWLRALSAAGQRTYVLRPSCWWIAVAVATGSSIEDVPV